MSEEAKNPEPHDKPSNSKEAADPEDDYRESEDEDYDPNGPNALQDDEPSDDDNDDKNDKNDPIESKEELNRKYRSIQGEGEGGLVKTRAQRLKEQAAEKEYKQVDVSSVSSSLDIDSIWKSLNDPSNNSSKGTSNDPSSSTGTSSLPDEEYIVIQRRYQFAGKVTTEEKRVLASSAEAKAYLAEQSGGTESAKRPASAVADLQQTQETKKKKPHKKKKSTLEAELAAAKAKKMNTLEKSRLDWASFVDKEGIKDDLTQFNKAGYLDKQDFLSRVEHKLDSDLKNSRKKNL